ncbi:MAG: site-2 protease family protein [Phycisphaeraceae bacterium]|nr:site-2 protease family protein [Phycisphaeraceae bacterium]
MLQSMALQTWFIAVLIVGFGFLIFVHELGHFLVAKAVGIKVTQFAIGFGPCILSWRKGMGLRFGSSEQEYERHQSLAGPEAAQTSETEYRLNWVPLGGYVKMLGQDDLKPDTNTSDPRSFVAKPIWARAAVVSAGVAMNLIFGLIFFIIAFTAGVGFNAPAVGRVVPGSPADVTYAQGHDGDPDYQGLRMGDQILALDGQPVTDLQDVRIQTALAREGRVIRLTVDRDGRKLDYDMTPEPGPAAVQGLLWLGFDAPASLTLPDDMDPQALPEELAEAGVRPGMTITAVGEKAVTSYTQFHSIFSASEGEPLPVTFAGTEGQAPKSVIVPLSAEPALETAKVGDTFVLHLLGLRPAVTVAEVVQGEPAEKVGIRAGDILAQLGEVNWPTDDQVARIVRETTSKLWIVVLRDGRLVEITPTETVHGRLGIAYHITDTPVFAAALPGSSAAGLNLPPGSRVQAVDDQPVATLRDMQRILHEKAVANPKGFEVRLSMALNLSQSPTENITLPVDAATASWLAQSSWQPPLPPEIFRYELVILKAHSPLQAVAIGLEKTHQSMLQVYLTLARLFEGTVRVEHLQGPVGIIYTGTRVIRQGTSYLLFFLGLISINLVVINFLPIPIVDGGLMVLLLIEKLKGSPVSERFQTWALYAGLALIGSVFIIVTYQDIARIITG